MRAEHLVLVVAALTSMVLVVRPLASLILGSTGITSVYVTHDQSEAMALSDRIAVMHQGELMQLGAVSVFEV